jgi:hypothetical protein
MRQLIESLNQKKLRADERLSTETRQQTWASFARRALIPCTLAAAAGAIACANPGLPPGAPERHTPPEVVRIIPDTNAVNVNARAVVVEFDAVVSERPAAPNATQLSDLVIVSPRQRGGLDVRWRRDNITIRPDRGWRPNTTYTVSIAPGIADLQGNVRQEPIELVFSTGSSIASSMIRGTVFDWLQGKPAPGAIVEAVPHPDSTLIYITRADSTGDFTLRVPSNTTYTVRASINTTRDLVFDPRMALDSTQVTLQDSARVEMLAYTRDTVGPSMGVVRYEDSVTIRAVFGTVIDPTQPLEVSQFALTTKDGTPVQIVSVTPSTLVNLKSDTTTGAAAERNGGVRPAPTLALPIQDTTSGKKPSKPQLFREVVIVVATPLQPKTDYVLKATNIRSPSGQTADSERAFTTPAPPPPPKDTTAKRS